MSTTNSRVFSGAKYAYIIIFFVLMAGFFHPLITDQPGDQVAYGTLSLLVGLVAAWPLYKAATDEKNRPFYLGVGIGLVALSLIFVLSLTGRF